jgi:hypothetical protein
MTHKPRGIHLYSQYQHPIVDQIMRLAGNLARWSTAISRGVLFFFRVKIGLAEFISGVLYTVQAIHLAPKLLRSHRLGYFFMRRLLCDHLSSIGRRASPERASSPFFF